MSRMLRSPSLRASTGLLGFGVLLWLLLRAPVSTPHHGITAHAPFEILASRLQEPTALARDPDTGDLYVAEAATGVILRIDSEGRVHTFATGFRRPVGLAWDAGDDASGAHDDSLLVIDEKAGKLSRIERLGVVTHLRDDLKRPHGVAVAKSRTLYVTAEEWAGFKLPPHEEGILLSFAPNGSNGQLLARGLKRPEGLRALSKGRVRFVADRLRTEPEHAGGTVFEYDPEGDLDVLVRDGFKQPHDLSLDVLDATYLTADRHRDEDEWRPEKGVIGKAFDQEGVALFATGLREPRGMLFDENGSLYVAEADTGRILKFLAPQPPVLEPRPPEVTKKATLTLTGTTEPNAVLTIRGATVPLPPQEDVSAQMALRTSHTSSHRQSRLTQRVTMTNTGNTPLAGPLAIVLTSLTPSEVTLANATGITVEGHPYLEVPLLGGLQRPGERAYATLHFTGSHRRRVRFTHAIWALRPTAVSDAEGQFSIHVTLTPNTENHLEIFSTPHYGLGLTSAPARFTVTATALMSIAITPQAPMRTVGNTLQFQATGTLTDGSTQDVTTGVTWTSSNESVATIGMSTGLALAKSEGSTIITAAHAPSGLTATATLTVNSLPPNPITVAPPLSRGVATGLKPATEFLYAGPNPIQTGVAPGTIDARRAAVLRGRVLSRDGNPLSGMTISVLNHPEYGTTLSRTDGMFDLAVNGGSQLTVRYGKAGYLTAQRPVTPPWQGYALLPDVILTPLDTQVTTVDLTAPTPIQVARGNPVTDADGTRRATLFFPQGTTATMQLLDGTTQLLTTLSVRATEYTVGPNGLNAMPGPLPPTSAYTYAVELSADEVLTAGAKTVRFSQPVIQYVENFLNFPVGGIVPVGYYDRDQAAWVPSDNGQVIKIHSVTGGLANLDVTGSGTPADASTLGRLGITDAERQQLAALYSVGQSLWRTPIAHFTPIDCNWPSGPPADATSPGQSAPRKPQTVNTPTTKCGSIIECQNQILGEAIAIFGTPFRLHYQSDRVPGYKIGTSLEIPLSGPSVPASLKRIELEVMVAGRRFTQSFAALPNQSYEFIWDGRDAYGRPAQGVYPATVRIGYVYNGVYLEPTGLLRSFALAGGAPIVGSPTRWDFTLWQEQVAAINAGWDARGLGLGGWLLHVHHTYDPGGRVLRLGTGQRRSAADVGTRVVTTVSTVPYEASLGESASVHLGLVDGQGNVFFVWYDLSPRTLQILKKSSDGTITPIAGSGYDPYSCSGDGGPATSATLGDYVGGMGMDAQGSLYFANCNRIRKVSSDGIITTVAGGGTDRLGEGIPATNARIWPDQIAVDGHGNLFFTEYYYNSYYDNLSRIRKVSPDGTITTVAGAYSGYSGDGGPATNSRLNWPTGVTVDPQGNLFIADAGNNRIRKVTPDGIIRTAAGNGTPCFSLPCGDGGLATSTQISSPHSVNVDRQGNLLFVDGSIYGPNILRQVSPEGTIVTVAGGGADGLGEGIPARSAQIWVDAMKVGPQGDLYLSNQSTYGWYRIRRITSSLPGFSVENFIIPSEDGSELYVFTASGLHLQTLNALTGATRYSFSYDSAGRLSALTDGDGNVTHIERDGAGDPTAIVAPFGQRTVLNVDGNRYLTRITDPAGNATQLSYSTDGLLATFTDPKGNPYSFTYDTLGRLTRDEDPAAGFTGLARAVSGDISTTTLTTALNRVSTYLVETLPSGSTHRVDTAPDGTRTDLLIGTDASRTTTAPDGAVMTLKQGPDPRFGMQAPIPSSLTVRTPAGLTSTVTTTRSVTLTDPNNYLSLATQTDTVTLNGRTYTSTYDGTLRQLTDTSPAGRQTVTMLDPQGRVLQRQVIGLEPIRFTYDPRGRLSTMTQGTGGVARSSTFAYNPQGFLAGFTDPLSRTVSFGYDLAGQLTGQILPDGRVIQTSYDANGNVSSITPPSRPAHAFTYTPVDLEASYTPPDLGIGTVATTHTYNADRQLTQVTRPDGQTLILTYEPTGGRLSSLMAATGQTTFTYHPTTGNLATIATPGGVGLSYTYDGSLLTGTTWTGPVAGSVGRTYDTDFRVASESVNGGNPITFQYDPDSLLIQAGSLRLTRHPQHGLLMGTTLGNVVDGFTYSSFGELSSYQAGFSGSPLLDVQYTRDALGRITQKVETIGGITTATGYSYDTAGRLTDVTVDGTPVAHYEYDGNGNRLAVTRLGIGTVSGTYDAQDRMTAYGAITYTYTKNGDLQTATSGSQTTTYTYDVFGNLTAVTLPTGTQIEYVIDGQNRRIGKKVNGTLDQGFLYGSQLQPVAELDGSGAVVAHFVYGTKINVPEYMIKGGTTHRLLTDNLGSIRLVVDTASGAVAQRIDYDEFGQITLDTNPGFQPFGFAGGLYDQHTKLVRFGARDYDAFTSRWTTKDPIRFRGGDVNLYGYTLNDPVNFVDPSGLWSPRTKALIKAGSATLGIAAGVAVIASTLPVSGPVLALAGALTLYSELEYLKAVRDLWRIESGECTSVDKGPLEDILGTFFGGTGSSIGKKADAAAWLASLGLAGYNAVSAYGEAAAAAGRLPLSKAQEAGYGALSAVGTLVAH